MSVDAGPERRPDPASARSWLFVPGDRGDRFAKASASGADIVVCDLEDAVADHVKDSARREVVRWLIEGGKACVRINPHGTPWHDEDVAALVDSPGLVAVMVPKAEDPATLGRLSTALGAGTPLVALVETPIGVHRVHELAAAPGVVRLAFGSIDLALEMGVQDDVLPLLMARSSLVLASRVAGLPAPVDGVTPELEDIPAVQAAAVAAAGLGFGGKLCVHPRQVGAVHQGFRPSEAEVRQAERVLAAVVAGGVAQIDGRMVDRPVVERARQVLRRCGADTGGPPSDTRRS